MFRFALLAVLFAPFLTTGCATLGIPEPAWPTWTSSADAPGTPAWWKRNKKRAEFVPEKGYQVAGTPGYFDQDGRPIHSRVPKQVRKKDGGGLLGDVQFASAVEGIKEQVGLGRDEQMAQQSYATAEDLFRREEYMKAASRFKQAISRWPDTSLEQDAMFQLAECYFFAEKYPQANDAYEALVQKYANTPHLDKLIRRQFDIARYWEKHHLHEPHWPVTPNMFDKRRPLFDTLGRAVKVYENIRLNDPTGPYADDSVMATANSFFLRGRYRDADYFYDLLRNEYPRSEHQYEAHVLGLQCKLRKYQGPDYDGTPLEEAKKLSRQLRMQFSNELDDEQRTRLAEIDARLNRQLALRVYSLGQYFDDKGEYGAARRYYADVLADYPDSELAAEARTRLIALAEEPETPDVPLESIVNLFPQNAERKAIARVPLLENMGDDLINNDIRIVDESGSVQSAVDPNATQRR